MARYQRGQKNGTGTGKLHIQGMKRGFRSLTGARKNEEETGLSPKEGE